jgi:hypothetical protein
MAAVVTQAAAAAASQARLIRVFTYSITAAVTPAALGRPYGGDTPATTGSFKQLQPDHAADKGHGSIVWPYD